MLKSKIAATVLVMAVPAGMAATPAQAVSDSDTRITVRVSDETPASGQTFRIRGRFIEDGSPAINQPVKAQTRRDGQWVPLRGARIHTNDEGRYRMRLVLSQRGKRLLRVVGVADTGANAYQRFTVRVH